MRSATTSWWAQAVQNRLIALVLAMIVIVPLVATPANSSLRGVAALAFEGFAILLLAVLLWRTRWNLRSENIMSFLRTGANLPVLLFLALATLSCVFSTQKGFSTQEILRLGAGILLYFVVAYQFRRSEYLSKLVDVLVFLAITVSLVSFIQYGVSPDKYATGIFGDHQMLGSFLMILMPIVAMVALTEKSVNRQLTAQVATVMTVTCLLLAHSRSAWVGGAAGLVVMSALAVFAAARRGNLAARKHELVLPLVLLLAASGFFLIIAPQSTSILNRAAAITQLDQERHDYWQGTLNMIKERPLTGFGIGLYPYYQHSYTGLGNSLASGMMRPHLNEQAHNFWLQLTAELGLPGLLLMVAILASFMVAGLRRVGRMDDGIRRSLLIGSLAAVVAFAVDAIASPSWQLGQNSMFFWLVLGLGVGCLRPLARREETQPVTAVSRRVMRPAAVMASLALAALLPTFVFAADGAYKVDLLSVNATPDTATVKAGLAQIYTLTATFLMSDGSTETFDVSEDPATTWTEDGAGAMTGPNNRTYQSKPRTLETVTVTGSHTFEGETESDSATLTVVR